VKLPLSSPQSLYSAVDDLRGTKADREQLEIEVKEVYTYAHIVTVSISIIHAIACIHLACILACVLHLYITCLLGLYTCMYISGSTSVNNDMTFSLHRKQTVLHWRGRQAENGWTQLLSVWIVRYVRQSRSCWAKKRHSRVLSLS